ncbi:MAG: hypothetical protein IKJ73_01835 [Lachnospiraceae bacterium]|nr:hypothetical protein [Lachnospiraceae bacterium]
MDEEKKEKIKEEKPKKQKKVKVVYDVDGKMKKEKKRQAAGFGKWNIIALIILLALEALFYYFITPAINIHTTGFWVWLAITVGGLLICTMDFSADNLVISHKKGQSQGVTGATKWFAIALGLCVVVPIVGGIASSAMFRASTYASIIEIQDGDFATDIAPSENINDIALMDTDSARIIGERAIGSLSDVVSQYEVSDSYSTIDYNGKPMKVATLEYAGFFKWFNNKDAGIPGYVLVDPVKNEAKYVKLENPIKYTPSGCFGDNLYRKVQMSYPTYDFNGFYFELDNEGNPYYICPVLKPNAGLFGAKDVKGVVIFDPCTGDSEYLEVGQIPNWVDRVYDGDLACQKYNWYGNLSGGFINSIIGNKGCKVTTDDYGYKVMNGDVWVYTGVTSVNGDQSNIGFVMMNSRTGESKYYTIAGAEEHSAMESAEGQVQNLGYEASFPSLINIDGVPTYIMVLKDNAGLVKMYALVNVEKYNIVATGATQREALASYRKLMVENGIVSNEVVISDETPNKEITVKEIRYISMEGETYVYITAKDGSVYKQNFADNETLIFVEPEMKIKVYYNETESGINELVSYE